MTANNPEKGRELIAENVRNILAELPPGVMLVAAAKTRDAAAIKEAITGGVTVVGENYLQEAENVYPEIGRAVKWHFIGHLQKNKVAKAVRLFDLIETVDSLALAVEINRRAAAIGKVMAVLIEVNSGREPQKAGAMPEDAPTLAAAIGKLPNLKLEGLMTVGPLSGDPDELRPYFALTKKVFDDIDRAAFPGVTMRYLSMGMTDSYPIAIDEGANMVRIGTRIFGSRG
jgi:PLP dependent protein